MATLAEVIQWVEGIYQIETTDYVEGGVTGVANLQANQLADRTAYLKELIENLDPEVSVEDLAADFLLGYANGGTNATTREGAVSNLQPDALYVRDEKSAGTHGGDFSSGAWRTRTLNTVVLNDIAGAALSSNQIILPAGTYRIFVQAPGCAVHRHKIKLVNITDGADVLNGTTENSSDPSDIDKVQTRSVARGVFTLADPKTFEVQHRCSDSLSNKGFGYADDFGVIEVFAEVFIEKIG